MNKLTTTLIGRQGYPIDNSYSFTIGTNIRPCLAGMSGEKPHLVTIVSEPYKLEHPCFGIIVTDTFITVKFNRQCHVILWLGEHDTEPSFVFK